MKISMVASSSIGYPLPEGALESHEMREVEGAFSRLARLGYDGVEISIEEPFRTEARRMSGISEQYGVEIPAIGTGLIYVRRRLSLSEPEEFKRIRAVKMLTRTIEIAAYLNSLVIVGLVRGKVGSQRKRMAKFRRSMRECDGAAEREGVQLAVEPLNRYEADNINNVEEALRLISDLNLGRTGLLLDTFHMNIEERSVEDAIGRAGGRLVHVHIADSNRLSPGKGHMQFGGVIKAIAEVGYDRYLSAEILASPKPVMAARITIGYLRELLAKYPHGTTSST